MLLFIFLCDSKIISTTITPGSWNGEKLLIEVTKLVAEKEKCPVERLVIINIIKVDELNPTKE